MPLNHVNGNLFDSPCQTLVIPTNCVGVMGAGLAKQAAQRYPTVLTRYQRYHREVGLTLDTLLCYPVEDNRFILLLPTKNHWRDPSRFEWVEANIQRLARGMARPDNRIHSLALPLLGCGLGGLPVEQVVACIQHYLADSEVPIELYLNPNGSFS